MRWIGDSGEGREGDGEAEELWIDRYGCIPLFLECCQGYVMFLILTLSRAVASQRTTDLRMPTLLVLYLLCSNEIIQSSHRGRTEPNASCRRYDALHLLSALPPHPSSDHVPASPASSTGWTDLPSDAEDTFFLSGDEGDVYSRGKKRRRMEAGRRERMEALRLKGEAEEEEERGKERVDEDVWGGDGEVVSRDGSYSFCL